MDADMDDIATGLSSGICKDGQSTITGNVPMGALLLREVGDAAADDDVLTRAIADARFAPGLLPGGRLTLVADAPVMTSSVTTGTLRYTPFAHNQVRHYNGSSFITATFTELSIAPTLAASTNYDVFSYLSGGSPALAVAAWTNESTREVGLTRTQGLWLNTNAVTAGPAALRGTYLGTVLTNASGQFSWLPQGSAADGFAAFLGVWNFFNRVTVTASSFDTRQVWTVGSEAWAHFGSSITRNRVTLVVGMAEEPISARISASIFAGDTTDVFIGLGVARPSDEVDEFSVAVNTPDGIAARGSSSDTDDTGISESAFYYGIPGIGAHLIQALEYGEEAQIHGGTTSPDPPPASGDPLANLTVELRA
jgi:hypothetical protein